VGSYICTKPMFRRILGVSAEERRSAVYMIYWTDRLRSDPRASFLPILAWRETLGFNKTPALVQPALDNTISGPDGEAIGFTLARRDGTPLIVQS
jgi:hypothetical protein